MTHDLINNLTTDILYGVIQDECLSFNDRFDCLKAYIKRVGHNPEQYWKNRKNKDSFRKFMKEQQSTNEA